MTEELSLFLKVFPVAEEVEISFALIFMLDEEMDPVSRIFYKYERKVRNKRIQRIFVSKVLG